MASNIKVDIVRPTATNGSLSLKGDSGGSATTNGVTVNSSGNTAITGTTTVSSLVATTADINGGTIDNTTIGGTTKAVGSFTQVNADNLRLDGNTISSTNTDGDINFTPDGNGSAVVTSAGTGDALRITQTGSGNALVVEDAANPDSTPFVVDATGKVGIGTTSPDELLHVSGDIAEIKLTNTNAISDTVGTEQVFKIGVEGQKNNVYGPAGSIIFRQDGSTWSSVDAFYKPTAIEFCTQDGSLTDNSETPRMRIDSSGNLKFDSGYGSVATAYGCRAWVNFDGTFGTSPFTIANGGIRASGNVSSVTDNGGNGDYTVNFTNAMPDANYVNTASVGNDEANQTNVFIRQSAFWRTYKTTSACRVITGYVTSSSYSVEDRQEVNVAIFR